MGIMVRILLTHSWLKFPDMLLFTLCVVICIKTTNNKVFDPKGSSPVNVVKI